MKIGIFDDYFLSLQTRLLMEGHTVICYVPGLPKLEADSFNVGPYRKGKLKQVMSLSELIDANCDFYITGTGDDQMPYEVLRASGFSVSGHSAEACLLETDREHAFRMNRLYGVTQFIKNPEQKAFTTREQLVRFLTTTKKRWVIKQSARSPQHVCDNRTIIFEQGTKEYLINLFTSESPNQFFVNDPENGWYGGALLEEFKQGQEVCFGRWFTGQAFTGDFYVCQEHKGAQNGNRGGLLTGEVGTSMTWCSAENNMGVSLDKVWNLLADMLRNKCQGMIDFNCILNDDGLHFIEYTIRFGRPTLEMQLANLNSTRIFNLGHSLSTNGGIMAPYTYKFAHGIGVTVFTYGLPVLTTGTTPKKIPFKMPADKRYTDKTEHTVEETVSMQLFSMYNGEQKSFITRPDARQFTTVGLSNSVIRARTNAYLGLANFALMGHTWRDDVGANHEKLLFSLEKHGYIHTPRCEER